MEYDLHSHVRVENALDSQTISGAGTIDGNSIDTLGFESLEYVIQTATVTAAGTDNVAVLEESATGAFAGEESLVGSEEVLGSVSISDDADDDRVFRIGSIGKERFQRLTIVSTGSPNLVLSAVAVLGHAKDVPQAEQAT